jgi:hypothetical protein
LEPLLELEPDDEPPELELPDPDFPEPELPEPEPLELPEPEPLELDEESEDVDDLAAGSDLVSAFAAESVLEDLSPVSVLVAPPGRSERLSLR